MLITRSAYSCATAWGGNEPRETTRSRRSGERGLEASDNETVSPSKANPIQPRYTKSRLANLSEKAKPASLGEETCEGTLGSDRGDWGERAVKEQRKVPGDPYWQGEGSCEKEVKVEPQRKDLNTGGGSIRRTWLRKSGYTENWNRNFCWESITSGGPTRKSEHPIVAKKKGNAYGAKGMCYNQVSTKRRRAA